MPACPKCKASVPLDARYCPECGALLSRDTRSAAPDAPESDDEEVHALLASANLLKLRGDWQAAVQKCMRALAIDPNSAAAHSLLGDIYCDQGKVGEATHWYKLALDLRPDSAAVRTKLDQLALRGLSVADRGTSTVSKPSSRTATRVIIEIIALLGLAALIGIVWPMMSKPPSSEPAPRGEAGPPEHATRAPVVISKSPSETVPEPVRSATSRRESALMQAFNASPSLSTRGLHVVGVSVDPRTEMATVTFVGPAPQQEPASQALVRWSLFVLREVCLKDNKAGYLTVRALYSMASDGGAAPEIAFIAEARRQAVLRVNPETDTYAELLSVMENPWWHPGLK